MFRAYDPDQVDLRRASSDDNVIGDEDDNDNVPYSSVSTHMTDVEGLF